MITKALEFVFAREGGHHFPVEGETYYGIYRKAWPEWNGWYIIDSIKGGDTSIKNNPLLKRLHAEFFTETYWDYLKCDLLPWPLSLCVFDSGVNCGRTRAARWLQVAVNLHGIPIKVDGRIGPVTVAAVESCEVSNLEMNFLALRIHYYTTLEIYDDNPGWFRRVSLLMKECGRYKKI